MSQLYDARGNIYAVCTPQGLRELGIDIADNAADAAANRNEWTSAAVHALCSWPDEVRPQGAKAHRSDGLLVGPFQQAPPFDLLIINTDGTLAERSGNGLTIFAQFLTDSACVHSTGFELRVHHDKDDAVTPVPTHVEPTTINGEQGFWLALGNPAFGPDAVGALSASLESPQLNSRAVVRVKPLAEIKPQWDRSVFVRVGNPHCVTLVNHQADLPSFESLHEQALSASLTRIAFTEGDLGAGQPCPAGVNLQWAWAASANQLVARVFERGEGPTASSGTSASAVACAAWYAGSVSAGLVQVEMPGGTAPVRLEEQNGELRVSLFGVAKAF
ncbi:diaminopimelate epimerase [Pseudomonas sp. S25]|uniref:Diaminopimelate epimerase n=1 Tax=Pseudomonas maioricensis TaxID=1766623 RepID=A0ABS9ZG75_9PSED|nr:diaminopimelate epimerase [Pseudomonas sp. S25]MCI8209442.1 diaminopimelate epimerase [Pseudomonas sp. S25]